MTLLWPPVLVLTELRCEETILLANVPVDYLDCTTEPCEDTVTTHQHYDSLELAVWIDEPMAQTVMPQLLARVKAGDVRIWFLTFRDHLPPITCCNVLSDVYLEGTDWGSRLLLSLGEVPTA